MDTIYTELSINLENDFLNFKIERKTERKMKLSLDSVKYRDDTGNTIFHLILKYSDIEKIKECLQFMKKHSLIPEKNYCDSTILHYFFLSDQKNLETIKYVFEFLIFHSPKMFLEKNNVGDTFLINFLAYNYNLKTKIKYVFGFINNNFPSLFFEKNNYGQTFINYFTINEDPETIKYFLNFVRNNIPEILTDALLIERSKREIFYGKVYKNPNYNLILPLTFQIQN